MIRKASGKKQPGQSGNGGSAVAEYGAHVPRAGAGSVTKAADAETELMSQEILRLVEASREGRLEERGRADQFHGTHRAMVQGINEMLNAILLPIGEGNRILAQISDGKIDELIAHTYKGDHEKMKVAINNVGSVVQGLQKELARLTDASKQGKLTERGDPEQFRGAYAGIVRGVNAILDAVIGPLNVAADYVEKISRGAIPAKISDTYNGDFNTIKNNLNNCIDNINALVADANMLAKAAVEGKLATRADASKHGGDYRKIVEGVNSTLDAVIGPLNVAANYVERISKGDLPPQITDTYNGDFNAIKNNLNTLIAAMDEVTRAAEEIAQGNLMVVVRERSAQDKLMQALIAMVGGLTRTVTDIRTIAGEVASASQSISAASVQVSNGATGQAASAEEASSSMEEMASNIKQNADNAQQTDKIATKSAKDAQESGKCVVEAVAAMKEIASKISIIEEIARQTNLLALNAAIEAARAGSAGRGFAVVADEVRKLAESSAQSTREIGNLVKDIQAKTGEVVKSTSESGAKAESGLQMADVAGRAIGDISSAVSEANRLIEQISMAAREQATGASAIVNSVEQMNALMREAARSLEEQNSSNRQIVDIIAAIQRHAGGVETAIVRQRTACDHLLESSKSLSAASRVARDASAGLDGIAETLRERVRAITDGTETRAGVEVEVARLTGGR